MENVENLEVMVVEAEERRHSQNDHMKIDFLPVG